MDTSHCANVVGADASSVEASKKVLKDLSSLNSRIGDYLSDSNVFMIRTGNFISGRVVCTMPAYMDCLYVVWGSDTVHSDKIAYSKIAIGLLDSFNKKLPGGDLRNNLHTRKRALDSSPNLSRSIHDDRHRNSQRFVTDHRDGGY